MRARALRTARPAAIAALLLLTLFAGRGAHAQTPANFVYQPVLVGWNLVGFFPDPSTTAGPIYAWLPGDRNYETPRAALDPGTGYWASYSEDSVYFLGFNDVTSATASIPAGQCAIVGNPSRTGSARVIGASRTYVFSTVLNSYIQENLIPIGRGAWTCNDDSATANVRIVDQGDVDDPSSSWPDCCSPRSISNGGNARVVVSNDTPYPLIAAMREIDASGAPVAGSTAGNPLFHGVNAACDSCPEYDNHTSCSPNATQESYNLEPGTYTLHIQVEGPSVPDLVAGSLQLQPNTEYFICYFVNVNRRQKNY